MLCYIFAASPEYHLLTSGLEVFVVFLFSRWFCMVPSFPELFTDDRGSVLVFFQSDVKGFGGFTDVVFYVLM